MYYFFQQSESICIKNTALIRFGRIRAIPNNRKQKIHINKVYDACRSKECIRDLQVYLTQCSQEIVNGATNVKARKAELIWVYIDVESVPFNRGFYAVDVRYFYRITAEASCGIGRPREICGLCSFEKRSILFGSEGNARIFSSRYVAGEPDVQTIERSNLPTAVVEVVDPLILEARLVEDCRHHGCGCCLTEVPNGIMQTFNDNIVLNNEGKRLFVTLGQFSIIRLERDIQLLMPSYDICVPEKECGGRGPRQQDPCEVFEQFEFPVDEFFPPRCECLNRDRPEVCRPERCRPRSCGCGEREEDPEDRGRCPGPRGCENDRGPGPGPRGCGDGDDRNRGPRGCMR